MSTIYTFHQECAALGEVPASDDELLIHDVSTGITKNLTVAQLHGAGGTVTAGTTAAAFSNNGITITQTTLGAFSLAAPDKVGLEKTILFPASTGIRSVTPSGATILGSTISPSGATVLTVTGTSDIVSASVTLVAGTTAIWYIKARSGPVVSS